MADEEKSTSHKGGKIHSYTVSFKITAIQYAELHGNRAAERKFNVDRKRIREWRAKRDEIGNMSAKVKGKERKRCDGAGRKPFSEKT